MLILLESVFCFFKIYLDFLLEIYIFTNPKIKKVKITSNHMNKAKNFKIEKEKLFNLASHPEDTIDVLSYLRGEFQKCGTVSEEQELAYQKFKYSTSERFGMPQVLATANAIHLITFIGECPHLCDRLSEVDSSHLSDFLNAVESDEFGDEINRVISKIGAARACLHMA